MKKLMLVGLCVVLLTGCFGGTKTLTCTMTETEFGMEMDMTMDVEFRRDRAVSINMDMKVTLEEEYAEFMDMFMDAFEEEFGALENQGWKVTMNNNGNIINIRISADIDDIKNADSDFLGVDIDFNMGYEENKREAEAAGAICR